MAKTESPRDKIVSALMELAADTPFDEISLQEICAKAGVTLAELREYFPSKGAIIASFSRHIDQIVLKNISSPHEDESSKDRLFDILMARLDAMKPHRAALKNILNWAKRDPSAALALNQMAANSQRFMLEAAGISTAGPIGVLKIQGLVITFARVMEVWFDDEGEDMGKTMAALDRALERGGKMVGRAEQVQRLTSPLCDFIGGVLKFRENNRKSRDDTRYTEQS